MVSGAHGMGSAGTGRALNSGGSARSGNEREGEQRRQISGGVASIRTFHQERSSEGFFGNRHGFTIYGVDCASASRKARLDSGGDARGWQRTAANSRSRCESIVLAADR